MKGFIVSVIAMLALVQLMVVPGQAITCPQVDVYMGSCVSYLTGGRPEPGEPCCSGVRSLIGAVNTPADKRDACRCVKAAANRFPTLKDDAAQALPAKCNAKLDFPVSRSVNCESLS